MFCSITKFGIKFVDQIKGAHELALIEKAYPVFSMWARCTQPRFFSVGEGGCRIVQELQREMKTLSPGFEDWGGGGHQSNNAGWPLGA